MKRILIIALLVCALAVVLCVAANAYDTPTTGGIYCETVLPDTIKAYAADGDDEITATDATIDSADVKFYAEAVRLVVRIPTDADYTLILMQDSTETKQETIRYIDQAAKDEGYVTFNVYPDKMEKGKTYYIYAVKAGSTGKGDPIATFQYYQSYTLGDVDENGTPAALNDAVMVLRHVAELETLTGTKYLAADVDRNGTVALNDAIILLRVLAELQSLPA